MKDFLDTVKDFCGENYIWMLVGAGVLLLLIIAAVTGAASRHSRRNNDSKAYDGGRDYFLEGEYDLLIKSQAEARHESHEDCEEHGKLDEDADEPECGDTDEEIQDNLIKSQEVQEDDDPCSCDEYEPEKELESLTDQPVCININIEHGQVKIGYGPDGELTCAVTEGDTAEDGGSETGTREEGRGQEIILEKINLIKGAPVKKFGPDNLNTGRSGRIYTEEELRRLIKE